MFSHKADVQGNVSLGGENEAEGDVTHIAEGLFCDEVFACVVVCGLMDWWWRWRMWSDGVIFV
jgi:hypothetical protein